MAAVGSASAASPGNPVPGVSPLHVDVVGSDTRRALSVRGCEGERCLADQVGRGAGLRVSTRPIAAAGAWVELGYDRQRMPGVGLDAQGLVASGGVGVAWPTGLVRPALSASIAQAWLVDAPDDNLGLSGGQVRDLTPELTGWVAFGDVEGQAMAWVGLGATPLASAAVGLTAESLDLALAPRWPATLRVGGEVWSNPLGGSWNPRRPQARMGIDLSALGTWGAQAWVGVSL